jgi:hypothetical protein
LKWEFSYKRSRHWSWFVGFWYILHEFERNVYLKLLIWLNLLERKLYFFNEGHQRFIEYTY